MSHTSAGKTDSISLGDAVKSNDIANARTKDDSVAYATATQTQSLAQMVTVTNSSECLAPTKSACSKLSREIALPNLLVPLTNSFRT